MHLINSMKEVSEFDCQILITWYNYAIWCRMIKDMFWEARKMSEKSKKTLLFGALAAVAVIAIIAVVVFALRKPETYRTLEIIECVGESMVYRDDKEIVAYEDMKLRSGDTVTVGENGYVRMKFDDDKYVYLEGYALIELIADGTKTDSRTIVNIEMGNMVTEVQNKLSDRSTYEINSPNTTMAIRGTITVTEVDYELPVNADGTAPAIQKKDIFAYLVKKNTGAATSSQEGSAGAEAAVGSEGAEALNEVLQKVEEYFKTDVKVKASSFVQEGTVEVTTYEKVTNEDGTTSLVAAVVPVEAGKGISMTVTEILPPQVINAITIDEEGKVSVEATEAVEEYLPDITENVAEVKRVETVEALNEVLSTKMVETIESVEKLNIKIDLSQGSISQVIMDTQTVWNEIASNPGTPATPDTPATLEGSVQGVVVHARK